MFGRFKDWFKMPATFRLPPEKSADEKVAEIFEEIGRLMYIGMHDGILDLESDAWEQGWESLDDAWLRLTVPGNCEALRKLIGTGGNPDGERMIQAAYQKSLERSRGLVKE
jgi:hypothetical protein